MFHEFVSLSSVEGIIELSDSSNMDLQISSEIQSVSNWISILAFDGLDFSSKEVRSKSKVLIDEFMRTCKIRKIDEKIEPKTGDIEIGIQDLINWNLEQIFYKKDTVKIEVVRSFCNFNKKTAEHSMSNSSNDIIERIDSEIIKKQHKLYIGYPELLVMVEIQKGEHSITIGDILRYMETKKIETSINRFSAINVYLNEKLNYGSKRGYVFRKIFTPNNFSITVYSVIW